MRLRNLFMILLLCMTVGLFAVSCSDGDTGPQGEQGEKGEKGDPGTPAPATTPPMMDDDKEEEVTEANCNDNKESVSAEGLRMFDGTTGDDIICGDEANNRIKADDGKDIVFGKTGNDTINGGRGNDTLHGGAGNDTLRGDEGDDVLEGGDGNDDLGGGPGDDSLKGGDGNDVFWSLVGGIEDGSDDFDGGKGTDTLNFSMVPNGEADSDNPSPEGFTDDSSVNIGNTQTFRTAEGNFNPDGEYIRGVYVNLVSGITDYTDEDETSDVYEGIENVVGSPFDDYIVGDSEDNELHGGDGNDRIEGGDGDDTIDPGTGTNYVDGGKGKDTLIVRALANLTDNSGLTNVSGIENLTVAQGSSAINLTAGPSGSILTAGAGASALTGGDGADGFVIPMSAELVTINGFGTGTTKDMIHFKGFPANSKVVRGGAPNPGANTNLVVNGEVVVNMDSAEAAGVIIAAPSTYIKFVD